MALLKLRRHTYFIDRTTVEVKPVSAGRFEVVADGEVTFLVVGGRAAGGSAREWFVHRPEMFGDAWVPCTSMIQAIRLGCSF